MPEHVARAFSLALSGRPGPVVLALPEDVLAEGAEVADASPVEIERAAPRREDLGRLRELLAAAERPLVVVGEGGWTRDTGKGVLAFCEANELPVACAFRCQDFVDNHSRCYVGVLGVAMDERIAARLRDADVVLAVGGRLGEVPTRRYTLLEAPRPRQTLVHVHPDPGELGFVYEADLAIAATLPELAHALRGLDLLEPVWKGWTEAARADYEENLRHEPMEGLVDLGEIMAFLRRRLPGDAIQTCGAGNFTVWAHRFAEFTQYGTQVCPRSGSMGYGVAAAVAAKLVHPDRIALCFTGDGDFVMSSPEFATAVQYELPIVVLLVNNRMYATIRMHQERVFPGRVIGTDLENPDFPALAEAYGGYGERVERTEDFEAAFERALGSGKPAVLELPVDPERISPRIKLSELQARAG
jgi:acetolactate synthase I/II/III large subunit